MRHIILSSMAHLLLPCFSTLFHKQHNFYLGGGGELLNNKFFFFFSLQFLLFLHRIQWDIINVPKFSCKVPAIIFLDFNETKIFSRLSAKHIKFNEKPSSGSQIGWCRHTERTKLTTTFHNFVRGGYKDLHKFEPTVIRLVTSRTRSHFICWSGRLADSLTWVLLSITYQKWWFNRWTNQIIML